MQIIHNVTKGIDCSLKKKKKKKKNSVQVPEKIIGKNPVPEKEKKIISETYSLKSEKKNKKLSNSETSKYQLNLVHNEDRFVTILL